MRMRFVCALALVALVGCNHETPKPPAPVVAAPAPAAPIQFVDITKQAGIDFVQNNGAFGAKLLPETMGSGVAFIDYDGDGYQDIVFIDGRDWTDAEVLAYKTGSG